jgi:HAD superfamily hydrolase (TIGR01509 family)
VKLKALIFDVDGTLADTEETHRAAWNEAFAEQRLDWNWSKPRYAHLLETAGGRERLRIHIESLGLAPEERDALIARIPAIHQSAIESYTRMIVAGLVPLRDGVERLIDEAVRAGVRLAIASATNRRNVEALLRVNMGDGALERFSVIGTGERAANKKPSPEIYHWVLRELQEPAHACVALEDSANGVRSAKAAGLFTVVTPSYWTRDEDFSLADLVLPSLGSAQRPFTGRAAALVGNTVLGLREIDRLLSGADSLNHASPPEHASPPQYADQGEAS